MPTPPTTITATDASSTPQGSGPLASLDGSPYGLDTFAYPATGIGGDDVPSWVQFHIYLPKGSKYLTKGNTAPGQSISQQNYDTLSKQGATFTGVTPHNALTAATITGAIAGGKTEISNFTSGNEFSAAGTAAGAAAGAGIATVLSEGITIEPQITRIKTAISIYMPDTVTVQYDWGYNTVSVTDALKDVGLGVAFGGSFTDFAKNLYGEGESIVKSMGGKALKYNNAQQAEVGAGIAGATGQVGSGFQDLTLRSAGAALNPMVQLTFSGVNLREFRYGFQFHATLPKRSCPDPSNYHDLQALRLT